MNRFLIPLGALCAMVAVGADAPDKKPDAVKPATNASTISTNVPRPAHTRGASREVALQEMEKMSVADGLEVTLFASEPMMVNPCDMDVDARGRVWITEGANYRKWASPPARPEGDRILILDDTNGD